MTVNRTDYTDEKFQSLVTALDAYLSGVNGDSDGFFRKFNQIDRLQHVVVFEQNGCAMACGAFKEIEPLVVEIKRMFTAPQGRNNGFATKVLEELEAWAMELGYQTAILETSKSMLDAIHLYQKNGYLVIPNYDQYIGVETSVCFSKKLGKN